MWQPQHPKFGNPLDLTGRVVKEANVAATVRSFLEDDGYDTVAMVTSLSDPLILAREADAFSSLAENAGKPLIVLTYTRPSPESIELLATLRLPWATSPARVARMIDQLARVGNGVRHIQQSECLAGPPASSFASPGRQVLTEPEAKQMLRAWGINVPAGSVATTPEEAIRIATMLGDRVAMKVVSSSLAHKSDSGGVALNL